MIVTKFCLTGFFVFLFCLHFSKATSVHSHTHGVFKLSLAFEGPKGLARLDLPADSIIGFEHKPKTAAERKQSDEALRKLEENFSSQLLFSAKLACQFSKTRVKLSYEGPAHADLEVEAGIACKNSPLGTSLDIMLLKTFPKLKQGQVDVLIENLQKSFEISPSASKIELK